MEESHRKPYIRPVPKTWWLKRKEYALYMVRELTAVFSLLVVIEIFAMICIAVITPESAQDIIGSILQHPAAIAFNIVALIAVIYHTITWYNIMPIGIRIFKSRAPEQTAMIPRWLMTAGMWIVTAVATAIVMLALYFAE